jgi:general secretion pathway protein F
MTVFAYRSLDTKGDITSGEIEALDIGVACEELRRQGLTPIKVSENGPTFLMRLQEPVTFFSKPKKRDIQAFLRDVARLLTSGLSVDHALELVGESQTNTIFADTISCLRTDIRKGESLAASLGKYPELFPVEITASIQAAELSATLPDTLETLSSSMDRALSFKERLKSALIYPALLFVMVVLTVILVVTTVLPQFAPFFEGNEDKLPIVTKLMMGFHDFLVVNGTSFVSLLVIAVFGAFVALQDIRIKTVFVRILGRTPSIKNWVITPNLISFCRTLGVCYQSGIALDKAFIMALDTVRAEHLRTDLLDVKKAVRRGEALSKGLSRLDWFPNMVLQFVRVGEQSGRMGHMLEEVASLIEQDFETRTEKTLEIISPLLTLLMGGIVALLVASVLLGIMSINDVSL